MTTFTKNAQIDRLLMTLIAMIALAVNLYQIDHESLFMDEIHQVSCYGLPFAAVKECALGTVQPPLDYWLGHFVFKLSTTDFAARLPAALFGAGSVLIFMMLLQGRVRRGVLYGLTLLYAISPFQIYFSQEARPYAIAIFFCLILVFFTERYLVRRTIGAIGFLTILLIAFLFLLSRTFSPLLIIVTLCTMLGYLSARHLWLREFSQLRERLLFLGSLLIALVMYLPVHVRLTQYANRYANGADNIGLDLLLDGLSKFHLLPGINAYLAQMDPIGLFAAPFLIFALVVNLRDFLRGRLHVFSIVAVLLPASLVFQVFVYLAKTSNPLRPPYLVGVQALSLLLCAYSLERLWCLEWRPLRLVRPLLATGMTFFALFTLWNFETTPKRENWRDLLFTIAAQAKKDELVIFDSVSRGHWKPYTYGTLRYDTGSAVLAKMPSLRDSVDKLITVRARPKLVLFYNRNIRLTSQSNISIMPQKSDSPDLSHYPLASDDLEITRFNGFLLIEPKFDDQNLLATTYRLFYRTVKLLPPKAPVTDMLLTAARIEALCPQVKIADFNPLELAQGIATDQEQPQLARTLELVKTAASDSAVGRCR
ncbi:MAG: glycosyltransferase family 39 protein [Candidatus Electrothrix gigas]